MQDLIDVWDPYAPMLMLTQTQNWLGDASKLDGFQLSKAVLNSPHFIYADDLPFGSDTLVFGFRNNINTAIYFIYLNAKAHNIILQTWNANNGRCGVEIMSDSPIYRIGYGMAQGNLISFNGHTGLTDAGTRVNDTNVWSFPYTFIANDFYCIATSNLYDPEGDSTLIIGDSVNYYESTEGIDFDVDIYPSINDKNNLLQQEQNDLIEEGNKLQEEQNETSKGIWESIKSIPDMIGEKLKSLFIPSDNFFSTYVSEFQDYFNDRFGLIYEIPEAIIAILQQFISYSPAESGYSIHFPEVVMPVLDGGEWNDRVLIEESDITFDFLEQGSFKTLYTMYRSVVWMIFIFALINLIIRKSERVFGGGG